MNYIVITVILTAVCAAFLFAQEADEISREIHRGKKQTSRSASGAPELPAAAAAAGVATVYAPDSLAQDPVWDAPAARIRFSGTSRMGAQTVALINGRFSGVGDLVEVRHDGRRYQWKVRQIGTDGKVNLERYAVETDTAVAEQEK